MSIREKWEETERLILSPYAALSSATKGRKCPEPPCAIRTEYQRDRDRIIHCKAFRRLKHKTQVFLAPEGDHFRTRLTHTLEVAQISRTVARALRLNEDLTEAIALGHDLGHTPFGHAGEEALNKVFSEGFKHNVQSLRVVEKLEQSKGLNLTWEVRDGILNHTGPDLPATLEGQIVKIADRVAYINHDIDDALRGGIITEGDLPRDCLEILGYRHRDRINTMVNDLIASSQGKAIITMSPEVKEATDKLRSYLFEHVYIGSLAKAEEAKAKRLVQDLFHFYCNHPESLPEEYRTKEDAGLERLVCDYIAGMTDNYATAQYTKLFIPRGFKVL
ncbi:deoxyguanosinetriphosphate triphosphohydrolase [Zhaonella formicivorans]|uniref:deoxyguanosinetriphosphate triphosphohydrolase n=1 Tax=Zhaonella formicivorans TaxID=2528593 RepID=UPI001D103594|nr:deoxyguanosinetriphosphate triphosphohydrolase [Zhaonella formicivorans]